MANAFEDAEGFRRSSLWNGFWQYLHPRLRVGSGYGYLNYHSAYGPFRRNPDGRNLHRHVVPLVLQSARPPASTWKPAGPSMIMAVGVNQARLGRQPTGRPHPAPDFLLLTVIMMSSSSSVPFGGPGACFSMILPATAVIAIISLTPSASGPKVSSEPMPPTPWP